MTKPTTTMKALEFVKKTGDIKVVQVPKPVLPHPTKKNKTFLLIKVVSAAIDQSLGKQFPKMKLPDGLFVHSGGSPLYLGWHYSGIVEETTKTKNDSDNDDGDDNHIFAVGTAVFGFLEYSPTQHQGSFAEYIVVDSHECAVKPDSVSFDLAAACATEATAALQALRDVGKLGSSSKNNNSGNDKSVLICGASGGVGSASICIAKLLGASKVTAMCSERDVERVRTVFQPDAIINRSTCQGDPIKSAGEPFDIIFDCPSAFDVIHYFGCLKPKGSFIQTAPSLGFAIGVLHSTLTFSSKHAQVVLCKPVREDLTLIGEWLAEGKLIVPIDSVYKIADMKAAIERQNSKDKEGRVVIKVQDGWGTDI